MTIEELLKELKCVTTDCDNNGSIAVINSEGDWEQQQCQFCDEVILPAKELIKKAYTASQSNMKKAVEGLEFIRKFGLDDNRDQIWVEFVKKSDVLELLSSDRKK